MDKELLIDSYFSNSLSEAEEKVLNQLLVEDQEFKERFEFERDLLRATEIREHRNVKSMLEGFERDISSTEKRSTPLARFRTWSIAASVAMVMGLGWLGFSTFMGTDYNELYNSNYVEYPSTVNSISRGGNDNLSLEQRAFEAYDHNLNQQAITLFTELKSTKNPDYADFYIAQAYLKLEDFKMAQAIFEAVIADKKEFAPEARWYLALTYLKKKEKGNATATLKEVIADGRYNKMEAEKLLEKLD